MSRAANTSLARTAYRVFFTEVNGLFVSSSIESYDKIDNLHPGTNEHLCNRALASLENNIGWVDSVGKLVKRRYPKIQSLIDGLELGNLPGPGSQSLFSLQSSPTVPGLEVVAELERPKLNTDTREEGPAASASDKAGSTKNATDTISQKGDNGSPALKNGLSTSVSATLHDGPTVVPSIKLCKRMSEGVGKSFSDFLRIISQWRAQTRHNTDHRQPEAASLIYVYSRLHTDSFDIGILRRGDG
jgi:hypothetical protein